MRAPLILEADMSQNQQGQQALKVGRDPRMLPEYEALRAEINKLSHASRPEVDWVRIHQLASQIFEKHGVDLQNLVHFIEGYTHLFDETEIVIVSDEPGLKEELQIPPMVFFKPDIEQSHGSVASASTPHLPQGSILVGREKGQVKPTVLKIEPHRKQRPAWFWFGCGLLSCALPMMGWFGWQHQQQEKAIAAQRLQQPAAALPQALSYDDIRQARIVLGEQTLQGMENELVSRYQAQLDRLERASPLYWYR